MSRSYKKPYVKCPVSCSKAKRQAGKAVRRIPSGRWFKKLYESYEIVDYKAYCDYKKGKRK